MTVACPKCEALVDRGCTDAGCPIDEKTGRVKRGRRNLAIKVTLTAEEKDVIVRAARVHKLKTAAWCRLVVMHRSKLLVDKPIAPERDFHVKQVNDGES